MDIGIFLPTGTNGFLMSTTSPQFVPSFDLNREIVQRAEAYGVDFALAMIKLRGFGGPSRYWDDNLEAFTLSSGLAAVTQRIRLVASIAVLTMPPALAARMAVTLDSISHGRTAVNIVSGWITSEYSQMGIWPGAAHFARRYEYCAEYVTIMRELWATGRSDFKGEFFRMDDCRCEPLPMAPIPIICAGQSDNGVGFAAEHGDYNFCSSAGFNEPERIGPAVARLVEASAKRGREVGSLVSIMVIADVTDEAALRKWEHYREGTDMAAIANRVREAQADPNPDPYGTRVRQTAIGTEKRPVSSGVLVGSHASIARMLDQVAALPGVRGAMLSFDDYIEGVERFGRHIQPLMRSRAHVG